MREVAEREELPQPLQVRGDAGVGVALDAANQLAEEGIEAYTREGLDFLGVWVGERVAELLGVAVALAPVLGLPGGPVEPADIGDLGLDIAIGSPRQRGKKSR